ncbi:LysR family transcriptional regulator [Kistimonas asteriae]|uniref:LysR family transcriptional regulator n=1 Tax=Kistimonas asteriae TaxID=517724 RepID=UPI001BAD7E72|nr:LysR family transcriptional regulator [Kistimonas asteriae]
MAQIDDMALFVQVVKSDGLAAAGRKLGLSPASMTARINKLELRYQTRLLSRNTRSIALTEEGERFYQGCLRIVEEMAAIEASLKGTDDQLTGSLRITAASDFGRHYVAPAVADFVKLHPDVTPCLYLTDGLVKLVEDRLDLAIRFGNLPDSNLIAKPLIDNYRVLCASPDYLSRCGLPEHPSDLLNHRCLVMERMGQLLNEWFFHDETDFSLKVQPAMVCSDGEMIRQWALDGCGIALKSYVDVMRDIKMGKLIPVLEGKIRDFNPNDIDTIGLQIIYPSRKYQPRQVKAFIEYLEDWIKKALED